MKVNFSGQHNPKGSTTEEEKRFAENYAKIFGRTAWRKDKLNKEKDGQGTSTKRVSEEQSE